MTGAVGGVLRQLPPAVVKPFIVATEATSNVLGGMRNQIHPDARQEESQKWRLGEEWATFSENYSGGLHYIRVDIHTGLSAYDMCAGFVLLVCNARQDLFCCLYFCLKHSQWQTTRSCGWRGLIPKWTIGGRLERFSPQNLCLTFTVTGVLYLKAAEMETHRSCWSKFN